MANSKKSILVDEANHELIAREIEIVEKMALIIHDADRRYPDSPFPADYHKEQAWRVVRAFPQLTADV